LFLLSLLQWRIQGGFIWFGRPYPQPARLYKTANHYVKLTYTVLLSSRLHHCSGL